MEQSPQVENSILEEAQGEVSSTEETHRVPVPASVQSQRRKFSIVRFEKQTAAVFSIIAKIFLILLVTFVVAFVVRQLSDDGYSIQQINVPASIAEAGYTGPVIANRISYRLHEILDATRQAEFSAGYSSSAAETDVSVDLVGMGVPVRAVVDMIGSAIGLAGRKKIHADIFIAGEQVQMLLKITGEPPVRFEAPLNANIELPLRELIVQASEDILKHTDGNTLQIYYSTMIRDGEKAIRLARYRLEKSKNNNEEQGSILADWARGLLILQKYDAAMEKINEGIKIAPTLPKLYRTYGILATQTQDYPLALSMARKAYTLASEQNLSSYENTTALINMGVSYSYLGKTDSAIFCYQRAIQFDPNSSYGYYNLAIEHLLAKDTTLFLDELDKAFELGLSLNVVNTDPDLNEIRNDLRMQKILQKYSDL